MARKRSSRRTLPSRAVAVVRKAIRSRAATPAKPRPIAQGSLRSANPSPPVRRRSVVRKPAREPSRRATKPTVRATSRRTLSPAPTPASVYAPVWAPPSSAHPAPPAPPAQEHARASQAPRLDIEGQFSIPTGYGDDRIVLMVKDPWWLYAYWEIQPATERSARSQLLPEEVAGLQTILRVHDVTGVTFPQAPAVRSFDIGLSGLATNWYIHTNAPNSAFLVDIGILTKTGRFLLLARSNRVTTPRTAPSELIDENWMTTDEAYMKLFGAAVGSAGSSPAGWMFLKSQQLFSGALAAPARQAVVRGFWYQLQTDLVLHGSTEPNASVKIQGEPVRVRKDGTFSLRAALPEGMRTIEIEVTSADGRQTRMTAPVVTLAWAGSPPPGTTAVRARTLRAPSEPPPREGASS